MIQKITLLFFLLTISLGYSQQVVVENFDGTAPTVNGFEGLGSATITADPENGSNNALELVTSNSGQPWQGAEVIMQSNLIDLTTDKTVVVDVYSTTAFTVLGKVEDKITTNPASATGAAHTGSGWETLTFTFTDGADGTTTANGEYSQIAFFPNWNGAGWTQPPIEITVYFDNITSAAGATLSTESLDLAGFKTYPNPTLDTWNIQTPNIEITNIRVYDILGKNVISMSPKTFEANIDGSSLRTGLYFAQIETPEGVGTIKLVKN